MILPTLVQWLPTRLPQVPVVQLLGIHPKPHLGVTHRHQFDKSKLSLPFDILYLKVPPPPGRLPSRPPGTQTGR